MLRHRTTPLDPRMRIAGAMLTLACTTRLLCMIPVPNIHIRIPSWTLKCIGMRIASYTYVLHRPGRAIAMGLRSRSGAGDLLIDTVTTQLFYIRARSAWRFAETPKTFNPDSVPTSEVHMWLLKIITVSRSVISDSPCSTRVARMARGISKERYHWSTCLIVVHPEYYRTAGTTQWQYRRSRSITRCSKISTIPRSSRYLVQSYGSNDRWS